MSETVAIKVPDIGDFDSVDVIEILVAPGDAVGVEQSLITLESDKATMEIPSPQAGTVGAMQVKVGDKVSQGDVIATLNVEAVAETPPADTAPAAPEPTAEPAGSATAPIPAATDKQAQVVVLGSGPGGYTAAFRAADLGLNTLLIERYPNIGGVCLNVGCIPSKALLHTAELITETRHADKRGVQFGEPQIDLDQVRAHKDGIVGKLTGGLSGLAKRRKVEVVTGVGQFTSPHSLTVDTADGPVSIGFEQCIIAAGSQPTEIPSFPNDDPRLIDSTGALALQDVPQRLLIIGGGIIGLEMATVYSALGAQITVCELMDQLMPGADPDLVKPFTKIVRKRYEAIYTGTKVVGIEPTDAGLKVNFEGDKAPDSDTFDRVLVAVGRRPNGDKIGADKAGVMVDERGFIPVDHQQRTNVPHIYAIGDIVGQPMLAHKATHEGKVAAEVISGEKVAFEPLTIPSVAYTDPELAWMGLSQAEAKDQGIEVTVAKFPWAASGRALGVDAAEGVTKLVFDKDSRKLLGAAMLGKNAGELIAETVLALEMGADAEDLGLTIHPHPTLSETINFAAEMAEGTITDLYIPKRK